MSDVEYSNMDSFLDAWLRGVELAGRRWFYTERANPGLALMTKWDFRPDYDKIAAGLSMMSDGEAMFLVCMYSFYNPTYAVELAKSAGLNIVPGRVSGWLDEPRRRVIADLLVSYEGW